MIWANTKVIDFELKESVNPETQMIGLFFMRIRDFEERDRCDSEGDEHQNQSVSDGGGNNFMFDIKIYLNIMRSSAHKGGERAYQNERIGAGGIH